MSVFIGLSMVCQRSPQDFGMGGDPARLQDGSLANVKSRTEILREERNGWELFIDVDPEKCTASRNQ